MDRDTLSNYGWIVIAIMIISVLLATASPFGTFMADGFKAAYTGLAETNGITNNMIGVASGAIYSPKNDLVNGKFYTSNGNNNYTVSLEIPYNATEQHDEVIVMVDGSTSVDTEWPAMREAIMKIGEAFLNGKGDTQLTLMAFGISPNVVDYHISSISELEALLNQYQGNLLYGRSATNCSGAFDGINRYIQQHNNSLANTYVVYITDGGVNQNNTPIVWHSSLQNYVSNADAAITVAEMVCRVADGKAIFTDTEKAIFGDDLDAMLNLGYEFFANNKDITKYNAIKTYANKTMPNGITKGKYWANEYLTDVFEYAGLDMTKEYAVYDIEKAFMDYKYAKNAGGEEVFYYIAGRTKALSNAKTNQNATVASGAITASLVDKFYLVQYLNDWRATWMSKIASEHANAEHTNAGAIANIENIIQYVLEDVAKTGYSDLVITDLVNKNLTLDPTSIKVTDVNNNIIAEFDESNSTKDANGNYTTFAYKWSNEALCEEIPPIILEALSETECAVYTETAGNVNGAVYKITWNVKDGVIYKNEFYKLTYDVSVDMKEPV